jgi:2-polyprenyl-3-methyl-5-hydroxy-6-metoxy-1,4-benzoquinol methylase
MLEARVEELEKKVAQLEATLMSLQAKSLLPNHLQQNIHSTEEFDALRVLLESKQWPEAVPSNLICPDSEEEKVKRAETILDLLIDLPLEGLRFLDFGCGEGHVSQKARRQTPKVVVGYDLVESETWKTFPEDGRIIYTTSWDEVTKEGPYNVVLMYDVLDHIGEQQDIVNTLVKVKQNIIKGGRLYVRCHPWCSRHATHLYHTVNKAYIHLVFTEDELAEMGHPNDHKFRCIHPMAQYQDIFNRAGFRIFRRGNTIQQNPEKFFTDTPLIAKRIKQRWSESVNPMLKNGSMFPIQQVAMQFIDFVLVPK